MHLRPLTLTALASPLLWLSGCDGNATNGTSATAGSDAQPAAAAPAAEGDAIEGVPFASTVVATFNEPWALAFLPDGSLLVTEKSGVLKHVTLPGGEAREIPGVPEVAYAGQGGLGDVMPHPQFAQNGLVYFTYAEDGDGGRGAAVGVDEHLGGPADDLAEDDPGVATSREEHGPGEGVRLLRGRQLSEHAPPLVLVADDGERLVVREVEVRARVAVGHGVDVERVDLGTPRGECGAGHHDPPAHGVSVEDLQHAVRVVEKDRPHAVLVVSCSLGYSVPVAR